MSDRIIGYLILSIIAVILLLPTGFLIRQNSTPVYIRTIEFSDAKTVSFLYRQDPVLINGAQVGEVLDLNTKSDKAVVRIQIKTPFILYNDYTITAYLKGLMGERYVSINPGKNLNSPVPENATLYGRFIAGPSEIIAFADSIKSVFKTINDLVLKLKDGTQETESFIKQFSDISGKADTLSITLNKFVNTVDQTLNKNRDTIEALLSTAISFADSLTNDLPEFLNDINKVMLNVNGIISKADTLVTKADSITGKIGNNDAFLWKDDIAKIQNDLKSLRSALNNIRNDGLTLPIRLRLRH